MKPILKLEFTPIAPFDFQLSLHKRAGWSWLTQFEIYENDTLWTGMRLDSEPIGLKLESLGSVKKPKIGVQVFSNPLDETQQIHLEEFLKEALAVEQELSGFYALCERYPALRQVKKDLYGMHTSIDPNLFHSALLAVTLQMAPVKRASRMRHALFEHYGERIRFDGREITLWPSAKSLAAASEQELRRKCRLGYRAKFIKAIAADFYTRRFPTREELLAMTPEEAKKELVKLKGIGDYSADIMTPYSGFPIDIWSVKIFCELLNIKMTKPPREMIPKLKEWAEKNWGEWRGLAFIYILNDLDNLKEKFKVDVSGTTADYIKEKKKMKDKRNARR